MREDDPPPPAEPALFAPAHSPPTPPIAERLADIRRAIKARRPLELAYDTGGHGAAAWRTIQPCMLESHGDVWLLRAYCNSRRADRVFRVDRIAAIRRL